MSSTGNAVIAQSGGPTAVINQSLVGAVKVLQKSKAIGKILGARHAVSGMVKNDFVDLKPWDEARLDRLAATPSSGLGSSRDKPDAEYCKKIFQALEKNDVRYFFYIGGNDSSDTCRIVAENARANGYELKAFHLPKTIDNDLVINDHTPGFGSAAKFVAQAFMGDNLDNKALPGIKINVIMGRHAGFLTAASVLARQKSGDGPHLIYVPEVAFDEQKFLADVDEMMKKHGRCLIAVSEGISDAAGKPIAVKLAESLGAQVEKDSHGNVQLSGTGALGDFLAQHIKKNLGAKRVRSDTFGYLQRCFAGCVSASDAAEARASGAKAAQLALEGMQEGSVTILRTSDNPYTIEYGVTELKNIAAKTKHLDKKYIVDGRTICDSFKLYLNPIVGELPMIEQV